MDNTRISAIVLLSIVIINSYIGSRLREKFVGQRYVESLVDRSIEKVMTTGLDAMQEGTNSLMSENNKKKYNRVFESMKKAVKNNSKKDSFKSKGKRGSKNGFKSKSKSKK